MNDILLPLGILQPPFFDSGRPDVSNILSLCLNSCTYHTNIIQVSCKYQQNIIQYVKQTTLVDLMSANFYLFVSTHVYSTMPLVSCFCLCLQTFSKKAAQTISFVKVLNYGGIGFSIGHELTHAFDDHGRRSCKTSRRISFVGELFQVWW